MTSSRGDGPRPQVSASAWLARRLRAAAAGRRAAQVCPLHAAEPVADGSGDCRCPSDRPLCYESGKAWCTRNDGRLDLHYFGLACETCACVASSGEEGSGSPSSTSAGCQAEGAGGAVPNLLGVCDCPESAPVCVTRKELHVSLGCRLPSGATAAVRTQYAADCAECSCRQACPEGSQNEFADAFGDCACPSVAPNCFEAGVLGCFTASSGSTRSQSYFRASCGSTCRCGVSRGSCEPASCTTRADCVYGACLDCAMCAGISRCPAAAASITPDDQGNCACAEGLVCFRDEIATTPGCPTAPAGLISISEFRVECQACLCETADEAAISSVLSCPDFALSDTPDPGGDCQCPPSAPECYQGGSRWCWRRDRTRDLMYFSASCTDCECKQRAFSTPAPRIKACPEFAAAELSDVYGNCICPAAAPVCKVSAGAGNASGDASEDKGCPTTHGWRSPNYFRYDCAGCFCEEIEGEGNRFKRIGEEELLDRDGKRYMKHFLSADVRLVGDLSKYMQEVERSLHEEATEPAWIAGLVAAVAATKPAAAVIVKVETLELRTYPDETLEWVLAVRVRVDFGIMWTAAKGVVKDVLSLTPRETMLLQNLPAIFSTGVFKEAFDKAYGEHLNATWFTVTLNNTGEAAAEGGPSQGAPSAGEEAETTTGARRLQQPAAQAGGGGEEKQQLFAYVEPMAPRPAITRGVLNDDLLEALAWTGPLEDKEPYRRKLIIPLGPVEEEYEIPVMTIAVSSGSAGAFCLLLCACCFIWRRIRARRRRAAQAAARAAAEAEGFSPTGSSPRSPSASPRGLSPRMLSSPGRSGSGIRSPGKTGSPLSSTGSSPRLGSPRAGSPRGGSSRGKKVDLKRIKQFGDLAGHKTLSATAKKILEEEYREKEKEAKEAKKRGRKGRSASPRGKRWGRGKSASDSESPRSPRDGEGGDSPRSPREGSAGSSDSPRSPRNGSDGDSPNSPREEEEKAGASSGRLGRWFRSPRSGRSGSSVGERSPGAGSAGRLKRLFGRGKQQASSEEIVSKTTTKESRIPQTSSAASSPEGYSPR